MSRPRPSIFRDSLQVSPGFIAAMGDVELTNLLRRLLRAQAYKCKSPVNEIRVNTEEKAKDDGCDGWSGKPEDADAWLGDCDTCWQLKAGTAGQAARLEGEVVKRIPKETLEKGGRLVVVASGSTNGKKGEEDRLATLVAEATKVGIPSSRIEVIGSERLAEWCNLHPAVAADLRGMPEGLWTLEDWSNDPEHKVPWQTAAQAQSEIEARRAELDFATDDVLHLHIHGHPGVGKTRYALELCRGAAWSSAVVYIRQAAELSPSVLIDGAAADKGVRLVVVADEVQPEQLRPLRDSVGRGNGRIRLITIGHCPSPEPRRIPAIQVKPLERQAMGSVINGWYPGMPTEHVDFVSRFAAGYVRLARLSADAVVGSPTMNVRELLSRDEIRGFLDKMLGSESRLALYVVAVLTKVGWTEDKQAEGEAVAKHLGLVWNEVRCEVDAFHRRWSIVPRGGRYRYISPTPLGIHLAAEAWAIYPDLLKSLPDALPSAESREAYSERFESIASSPHARQFAREELSSFFRIEDFIDDGAVRRWSALSAAGTDEAARNLLKVLSVATIEERQRIRGSARSEMVWTLVRLAWNCSSFHDATMALALLAEAENETFSNNASGEFVARYQVFLGGTAVPYEQRLSVLDDLLATGRAALMKLAVRALAKVGSLHETRMEISPASDEPREAEWHPEGRGHLECVEAALGRLCQVAKLGEPGVQLELLAAAKNLHVLLREGASQPLCVAFFDAVRQGYPESREELRRLIADAIRHELEFSSAPSAELVTALEVAHVRYQDSALGSRLLQYVGHRSWDPDERPDLASLAKELLSSRESLEEHWQWLTSGEAAGGWWLGEALAKLDTDGAFAETLLSLPVDGNDLRLVCAYVEGRRSVSVDEWYDGWTAQQNARLPRPTQLLFEIAWRCGATPSLARMIATILEGEQVSPHVVGGLAYGRWSERLSGDDLAPLVRSLVNAGYRGVALQVLHHRMDGRVDEFERWKLMALELVTSSELIRDGYQSSYSWGKVTKMLVAEYGREIATAILREQSDRESSSWFAEHSEAASILSACVARDPIGLWEAIHPHLSSPLAAHSFSVGFPVGILERIPVDTIEAWVAEVPAERASMVARMMAKDLSRDDSLASRILGQYGDRDNVSGAFFAKYASGGWTGLASAHWDQVAAGLDEVVVRTKLPRLRRWASESARSLREMANKDRAREEEEELRGLR